MEIAKIEGLIYVVRGQRVMLDADLALLYGVTTGNLNKAVARNLNRFPADFSFQLDGAEWRGLIFQIGISKSGRGGRRQLPRAFTEQGVAMLSSVLRSERAALVNVGIMRAFVRMRRALAASRDLAERMEKVEKRLSAHEGALSEHAQAIRSVFEDIRRLMGPPDGPRKKIGF